MGQATDSFQAKVNTVMARLKVYEEIEGDLVQLGVRPENAKEIVSELNETTKHAANALQVIRRTLGDVHGKKPAYTRLTYDAIKWASAICGPLEGKGRYVVARACEFLSTKFLPPTPRSPSFRPPNTHA